MTDAELVAAGWQELTKTTDSYPKWKSRGFPKNTHWGAAKALFDQVGQAPPPPPPPPPPPGLSVDRATMLAVGGKILRQDDCSTADALTGLWGQFSNNNPARLVYKTSGGDPRPKADGSPQT